MWAQQPHPVQTLCLQSSASQNKGSLNEENQNRYIQFPVQGV